MLETEGKHLAPGRCVAVSSAEGNFRIGGKKGNLQPTELTWDPLGRKKVTLKEIKCRERAREIPFFFTNASRGP